MRKNYSAVYSFLTENPDLSKSRMKAKNYTLCRTEEFSNDNLGFQLESSKLGKKTLDFQSREVYKDLTWLADCEYT